MPDNNILAPKGHERVAGHLRAQIREGRFLPGEKLPSVADMAAAYGVGRSTVREAISGLKATGWITVRHGGGTFVSAVLPSAEARGADAFFREAKSLMELLEVRKILETGAASLAAERRTGPDLERLGAIVERMARGLRDGATAESEQADAAFHTAIAAASGNPLLLRLMESLSGRLSATISKTRELWFYRDRSTAAELLAEHRAIFAAIEGRDPEQAAGLIQAHLTKVETVLRQALPTG